MALAHEQHPELFDLPGDTRPRKIYQARGSRLVSPKGARRKEWRYNTTYVNAPTLQIAERTARNWLRKMGWNFDCIYQITWEEYGEVLSRSGFTVTFPAKKAAA